MHSILWLTDDESLRKTIADKLSTMCAAGYEIMAFPMRMGMNFVGSNSTAFTFIMIHCAKGDTKHADNARALRKKFPRLPLILVHDTKDTQVGSFVGNLNAIPLPRPVTESKLRQAVKRALNASESGEQAAPSVPLALIEYTKGESVAAWTNALAQVGYSTQMVGYPIEEQDDTTVQKPPIVIALIFNLNHFAQLMERARTHRQAFPSVPIVFVVQAEVELREIVHQVTDLRAFILDDRPEAFQAFLRTKLFSILDHSS